MRRISVAMAATAMTLGLVAAGCAGSPHPTARPSRTATTPTATTPAATTTEQATTSPTTTTTSVASSAQLEALIPTPANTRRTDGPDLITDNGIHMHFMVNGSPNDVMAAYQAELEGKGWAVTVVDSGSGPGGGGATYTGTQSDAYGVFTGGGSGGRTNINACAWPAKPSNPNCGGRR